MESNRIYACRVFFLALLMISILLLSAAEEPEEIVHPEHNAMAPVAGNLALQFQITDFIRLSNFQGLMLSGKYHFSNRSAVRTGVNLSFSDMNMEDERLQYSPIENDMVRNFLDIKRRTTSVTIYTQYVYYSSASSRLHVYYGAGPFYELTYQTEDRETVSQSVITVTSTSDQSSWAVGANGVLGVEWFFTSGMSLLGEYSNAISYSDVNNETIEKDGEGVVRVERNITSNNVVFRANNVRFGLSVYF